jgi:serine/threonine-protein kinase
MVNAPFENSRRAVFLAEGRADVDKMVRSRPPSGLVPGQRLKDYELLCIIGQGGMASVWAARRHTDAGPGELVAIKTILPAYAHDSRFRAMFLDEGRIASRIEHMNVARILDLGEEENLLYLVMEWIHGDSLSQLQRRLLQQGVEMPLGILLRIMADLCGGLHAAHELCDAAGNSMSVVHRDVSPENILLDSSGMAKLIDFGVAKARDRAAEETKTGILKGKLSYMAPEQALRGDADRRADVWAVGAILYKFLSGKAPFWGDTQVATLCMLVSGSNPPPLPAHVHPAVAAVVERALRHDAKQRFATAAELQKALIAAMVDAEVPTTTDDVGAFVCKHLSVRLTQKREAIAKAVHRLEHPSTEVTPSKGGAAVDFETLATDAKRQAITAVASDPMVRPFATLTRVVQALGIALVVLCSSVVWRSHGRPLPSVAAFTSTALAATAPSIAPTPPAPPAEPIALAAVPAPSSDEQVTTSTAVPDVAAPLASATPSTTSKRNAKHDKSASPTARPRRKRAVTHTTSGGSEG